MCKILVLKFKIDCFFTITDILVLKACENDNIFYPRIPRRTTKKLRIELIHL